MYNITIDIHQNKINCIPRYKLTKLRPKYVPLLGVVTKNGIPFDIFLTHAHYELETS